MSTKHFIMTSANKIARKFTKALRFKAAQYVETSWDDDGDSNRKPETVEFRFRAVSGSDQILVQKDTDWAIKLKDNGSTDNKGTVAFMLTGSFGLQEISSSLLPVFDGEYHSVMLRKTKVEENLFQSSSFEITSFKKFGLLIKLFIIPNTLLESISLCVAFNNNGLISPNLDKTFFPNRN